MALHKGFFSDEGVNLRIEVVAGGEALAQAMGRGEIQIGRMGSPPFLTAVGAGVLPGKIVGSSVIHNLDHFLFVVHPDIQQLSQLRETTVGVLSRGSCDGHLMQLELQRAGLNPERDVAYEELRENYLRLDGLASGRISAQLSLEPLVSIGEQQGVLRIVEPVSRVKPRFHCGLLVAREDFIAEQPVLLRKLLRAYLKSARYCVAHPDETKALLCKATPEYQPAAIERALLRALPIWNTSGLIDMEGLGTAVDTMRELGAIDRQLNPDKLIDLSGRP